MKRQPTLEELGVIQIGESVEADTMQNIVENEFPNFELIVINPETSEYYFCNKAKTKASEVFKIARQNYNEIRKHFFKMQEARRKTIGNAKQKGLF